MLLTLVMVSIMATVAMSLFSATNTQMMIAGNNRRIAQAKLAACSGLNHFIALDLSYNELRQLVEPGEVLFEVIPETSLSTHTYYQVAVRFLSTPSHTYSEKYIVESTGFYKKGDRVISIHVSKALYLGR